MRVPVNIPFQPTSEPVAVILRKEPPTILLPPPSLSTQEQKHGPHFIIRALDHHSVKPGIASQWHRMVGTLNELREQIL